MKLETKYDNTTIAFEVRYRNRKTIVIRIEPLEKILVDSPVGLSENYIKEKVKSKGKWIIKKLLAFKETGYLPSGKEFKDGENFLYLGKNYLFNVILDTSIVRPEIRLSEDKISVISPSKDYATLRTAMEKWYKKEAEKNVLKRIEYYKSQLRVNPGEIKIKEQKRRWGSCTSKGSIYFNWRIIMAPIAVFDYILVHEMSHLIHANHSPRFWKLVESIIPNYKDRKKWLKDYGVRLEL